ncbi:Protein kinase domain-containing protein [Meloidogyne graminicola]|uniref:Protein kinase domain-containing protein n=1 Tax=Meloidogyne graminicola TaxID=189291 RepID=A0A8S9ZHB0_9BILA|nr:Protein kinase domain-containing protein [Meloidogyne graminicola]
MKDLEDKIINKEIHLKIEYINRGNIGYVFHAYWEEMNKCVALKKSGMYDMVDAEVGGLNGIRKLLNDVIQREVKVLEYINKNVNDDKRNYIIKMFGYEERNNGENKHFMYIVLELGGKNLRQYYDEKIKENKNYQYYMEIIETNEDILIKLIKGAALALEQFHNFGVHGNVRPENFVISLEQNPGLDFIEVKLIDFKTSIVGDLTPLPDTEHLATDIKAPEIKETDNLTREADIWAFGQMVKYLLPRKSSDIKNTKKLNRVINECQREDPKDRPETKKIYKFLTDEIEFLTKNDEKDQKEIAENK